MCYDFLVLILSIVKLSTQPSKSRLGERLRAQGLLYFAVAAIAYILPTVWTLHHVTCCCHILIRCLQVFSFLNSTRMKSICVFVFLRD